MSRVEEIASTSISPILESTNVKETAEDLLAKQVNEIVKELELSDLTATSKTSLSPEKITTPTGEALVTAEIASRKFNVAWDIIKLGLQLEQRIIQGLNETNDKIEKLQEKSKAILALQQKLTKLTPDKKSLSITEELKADLSKLKEFGIDLLLDETKEISAERLASIKVTLDGHKSQVQTDTQKFFMDIQTKTQQLSSLLDSLKIALKHHSNLMSTITQNMMR